MYSGYELIWLFFCTSFLGWLLRLYQQQQDRENISECIESRIKF